MASFACSSLLSIKLSSQISLKVDQSCQAMQPQSSIGASTAEHIGPRMTKIGAKISNRWSFMRGAEVVVTSDVISFISNRKLSGISSSLLTSSQIASSIFTLGTVAVLPFYTLMIFAPKANLTRRSMESSIPYIVLGALYAYLLDISWTPDTIRMMFASKYWLPELPGMVKLFSSELTLASAWIHLLAVDLFAARQVYFDGLENDIETRHSVSLCLLFCPIGVVSHVITKALTKRAAQTTNRKFD